MSTTTAFHLRALACAGFHFGFCIVLGATVLALTVADVMTTSSELAPPLWITGGYWLLMVLSAPLAVFFGLWKEPAWTQPVSLLIALSWSLLVGYLISLIWRIVESAIAKRSNH